MPLPLHRSPDLALRRGGVLLRGCRVLLRAGLALVALTLAAVAQPVAIAWAVEPEPTPSTQTPPVAIPAQPALPPQVPVLPEAPPALRPLVSLGWKGELRLRAERLSGVRLVTTDPAIPPRLDLRHRNDSTGLPEGPADSDAGNGVFGTADVRLRLRPTLHVGEWSDIRGQIDLPAGFVFGGDPKEETLGSLFTGDHGQRPIRGSVAVRRLWLQARVFDFGELMLGRMPDHFGLGIYRNGGGSLGGDFQSDVDRVAIKTELLGLRWMAARDSLASFPAASSGTTAIGYSLQDSADVSRWLFEVGGGRIRQQRGFEWAGAIGYTTQAVGLYLEHDATLQAATCVDDGTCARLLARGASFIVPQFSIDWRGGDARNRMRVQAEAVLRYGTLERSDVLENTLTEKMIISGGGAVQASWRRGRHEGRFDFGAASGESDGGFGVLDTHNFLQGGATQGAPHRDTLTGFRFHRDYRVDGILFRDLIGAVANAYYLRPAWTLHLLEGGSVDGQADGLSLQAGVLAALAASSGATPGKASFLGVEPELLVEHRAGPSTAHLRATWLLPGAALARPATGNSSGAPADPAWRLEALWRLAF